MTRIAAYLGQLILVTVALIAATAAIGWWGIAIAAFVWGMWAAHSTQQDAHGTRAATCASIAAALAWTSLLLWTAARGPLPALITALGQIAGAPGSVLVVATVLFPALLAWSAATVGSALSAYLVRQSLPTAH
jgi:hypothetical protein